MCASCRYYVGLKTSTFGKNIGAELVSYETPFMDQF